MKYIFNILFKNLCASLTLSEINIPSITVSMVDVIYCFTFSLMSHLFIESFIIWT